MRAASPAGSAQSALLRTKARWYGAYALWAPSSFGEYMLAEYLGILFLITIFV